MTRYYKNFSAPRQRWLKPTAARSGSKEEKRSGLLAAPDLHRRNLTDPIYSQFRLGQHLSLPLPTGRGNLYPEKFGNRLRAREGKQPVSTGYQPVLDTNIEHQEQEVHLIYSMASSIPSSDEIFTVPSTEGVPTVASSPQPVTVSSASSREKAAAAYTVQGGFDIAVSEYSLPATVEQVGSSSMEQQRSLPSSSSSEDMELLEAQAALAEAKLKLQLARTRRPSGPRPPATAPRLRMFIFLLMPPLRSRS